MAAAELTIAAAEELLRTWEGRLVIAAHNGPSAITVAGDSAAVDEFVAHPSLAGRFVRRLNVDRAFHSPGMQVAADEIGRALAALSPSAARIPIYSSVTPGTVPGSELGAAYWARNLRERVRFADAAAALLRDGYRHFVEIGPHPALLPAMGQAADGKVVTLPSLRRGQDDRTVMLETLGRLYADGSTVNWRRVADGGARCISLPAYAWQKERYWFDPGAPPPRVADSPAVLAPLLGRRLDTPFFDGVLFETLLAEDSLPWLADHRLAGACVLPATGMIEMVLAAAAQLLGADARIELVDGAIHRALAIPRAGAQRVQIGLAADGERRWRVKIVSRADAKEQPWQTHLECVLLSAVGNAAPMPAPRIRGGDVALDGLYDRMTARGIELGLSFRALSSLRHDGSEAFATVAPDRRELEPAYRLFPPLLDACFHAVEPFFQASTATWLPVGFASLRLLGRPAALASSSVRLVSGTAAETTELAADIAVFDETGAPCVAIRGFRLRAVSFDTLRRLTAPTMDTLLREPVWEPTTETEPGTATGAWLLVADGAGVADAFAAGLRADGAHCLILELGPPGAAYEVSAAQRRCIDGHDVEHYRRALREGATRFDRVVHLAALDVRNDDGTDPLGAQERVGRPALALVQALGGSGAELWLVTSGVKIFPDTKGSLQAPLWGFGAVLDFENPELHCRLIDLDPGDSHVAHAAALLGEARSPDRENRVAWSDGKRHAERLRPIAAPRRDPWELRPPTTGRLEDLAPTAAQQAAVGPNDVLIETHAVGLNFRDVLNALGMLGADAPVLGGECAGTVVEVGAAVDRSLLGARVMAFRRGGFASQVVVPQSQVARAPAGMGHAEAASLPVVFLTALYGLEDLAQLAPGEVVLIHAATGGVGLAALQVAAACGATVIATAGSDAKREYLRSLGVPHVFSSRTTEFAAAAVQVTGGRGVDVVLNSLSDQFVAASFAALRSGGRFVELGKRGVWSRAEAAQRRPDARYLPFDLSDVAASEPATLARLFAALTAGLTAGRYRPIPYRSYGFDSVRDAFDYMARARHIGKLVIRLPEPSASAPTVRADASYVLTGAAGGLGPSVAASLVERGARHLALLGRKPPGPRASVAFEALRATGAVLEFVTCDLTSSASVDRAFDEIEASMPPVRGIFHLAGVIDDAPVATLSWPRFASVLAPKTTGTQQLERRARRLELDHFVLYSSAAAVFGWPGQSAYASGNAYLDAVARRRRSAGLPGLSINWGPWTDAGMAAETADRKGTDFAARGLGMLTHVEADAALGRLLDSSPPQVLAAWLDAQRLPRGSLLADAGGRATSPALREERSGDAHGATRRAISAASGANRSLLLKAAIEREAARALGLKSGYRFDASRPLNELGLDSLLAVQLANALSALLDAPLSATLLFDYPTIDALTLHLGSLTELIPQPTAAGAVPPVPAPDVAAISDEAAAELLIAELDSLKQVRERR
jgi:NADPH:quinone reductase-like Zn-dependent oxidoreductase